MTFQLSDVVPWGRSFDEYVAMFGLTAADLRGRILGCGDGPASFNAIATERGYRVISADPLYVFTADEIRRRIEDTAHTIGAEIRRNPQEVRASYVPSRLRLAMGVAGAPVLPGARMAG